ncbi:MAG: TPM domain-containing protein [Pyrinomonadaceae bacterium]
MNTIRESVRRSLLIIIISALGGVTQHALAQSQLPDPSTRVSDFAGVLDAGAREQFESTLANLKQRSKIDLYVVTVQDTGEVELFEFSQKLARDWNIGWRSSPGKSLLLVISVAAKNSFTQFNRRVQNDLPDGMLGDVSQRMRGLLSSGQFAKAVDGAIHQFATALSQKIGFSLDEIDKPTNVVAERNSEPINSEAPTPTPDLQAIKVAATEKTRPRIVSDIKPAQPARALKSKTASVPVRTPANQTPEQVDDDAEAEEVELTLTLPLAERALKLQEFLANHPNSKSRTRATELLISTHAGLGDQQMKNGDSTGGVDQMMLAISEADPSISDKLFSGVISQIPLNLYLRGERAAAFKAAQEIETKFGADPKRLVTLSGFYMGIERGDEAIRLAEETLKLAPDMAEAHHALALGLHISLRLEEAIAEYKRAVELDPTLKTARASLADLTRASGKSEEALALYNEQLKSDPKDKSARTGVVMALLDLSRDDEATPALNAALGEDPRNLPLLTSAAYWFATQQKYDRALELAQQAVAIEPRYTWAQIALAHALIGLKRPVEAERSIRYARQYGKFPTLNYELASVLSRMGLYEEAAEALRDSFEFRDGKIETRLAGRFPAADTNFLDLLAPERRGSIYQYKPADTETNANTLRALLALTSALHPAESRPNEEAAIAAAREFVAGTDNMRAYREVYAASRLLQSNFGLSTVLEFTDDASKLFEAAMDVPTVTLAVQADEYRELRARAIASGSIPEIADAPRNVLSKIFRGRIEDLTGWAFFVQDKPTEAIAHLRSAASTLPEGTPAWRGALWHLGVALEQASNNEEALDNYIRSFNSGEKNQIRRTTIERLYRKVHGSLEGLDDRIGASVISESAATSGPVKSDNQPSLTPSDSSSSNDEKIPAPPTAVPLSPADSTTPNKENQTAKTDPPVTAPEPTPSLSPQQTSAGSETATRGSGLPTSDPAAIAAATRLRSNIKIAGRIIDADKNGVPNVVVVLISPSGTVLAATSDSEGRYSFTVAPSLKTYRLIPSKEGVVFAPLDKTFAGLLDDQKDVDFVGSMNRE